MSDLPPINQKYGIDATDYVSGVRAMNKELRLIDSAFKASASALGDWGSSAEGLESRMDTLTKKIEVQKDKLAATRAEYERMASAGKTSTQELKEQEIKINNETAALNKLQVELGQTEKRLHDLRSPTQDAAEGMDRLERETEGTSSAMDKLKGIAGGLGTALKVTTGIVAGLAAGVAAAGAGVAKLVLDSSELAGELVDTSLKTGISTERLQELSYIGSQVGTDLDTMTGSLARMTRAMDDVGTSKEITSAFERLGVAARDNNGELRDSETVFGELLTALGGVANETERDALALTIFGRSAMELNPLIKAGGDEMMRLADEAHQVGAVMSDEAVIGLEGFGDSLASLKAGLQGTLGELASAFLPGFQGLVGAAQGYLGQFSEIVRGADGDLVKMADGVGNLLGQIVNDIAQKAPELMKSGLNMIQGVLNSISENLPMLLDGAVSIIRSLVQFLTDNLPMIIDVALQILLTLVEALVENLPMLVEAGIKAIISLIEGLAEAMPRLIPAIVEAILLIVETLIVNLPLLVEAGGKLLIGIATGLAEALPMLIEKAPELIQALADALIAIIPILAQVGLEMLKIIAGAIVENLPLMAEAGWKMLKIYIDTTIRAAKELWEAGKYLVVGIWNGIKDNWGWFVDQLQGYFQNMIQGVKDILGISSPSKVFAEIGANVGRSYIDSLGDAVSKGTRALQTALGDSSVALGGAALAGAAQASQVIHNNYFNLNASYSQSPANLPADVRMLQMLYGTG